MDTALIQCPYCGEQIEVAVDRSVPRQEYVEDCQVCCRPMTLRVTVEGGQPRIDARSDAD